MNIRRCLLLIGVALSTAATRSNADTTLTVGPNGQYRTISAAVAAADADTNPSNYYLHVAPGTYTNDFPVVTRPMTIAVDPPQAGQQVLLKATEPLPNGKGIILTTASLTVSGLTFTGAMIPSPLGGNGAGIRDQNKGSARLVVENSSFIDNQEGILTGDDSDETVTIVNSKFVNNGNPDRNRYQHALYVNGVSLTVSNSLFCGQLIGHDIKSRARVTTIENNRIYDGQAEPALGCRAGSTSFGIDAPNGGVVTISGNRLIQGATTENYKMVAYGEEGLTYSNNELLLSGNIFTNFAPHSIGVYDPHCIPARLVNNTFHDVATPVDPPECAVYQ